MSSPSKRQKVVDTRPQQNEPPTKPKPSILARMPVDLRHHILGFGHNHRQRLRPSLFRIRDTRNRCPVCSFWTMFNKLTETRPVSPCHRCNTWACDNHDEWWYQEWDQEFNEPLCRECYDHWELFRDD